MAVTSALRRAARDDLVHHEAECHVAAPAGQRESLGDTRQDRGQALLAIIRVIPDGARVDELAGYAFCRGRRDGAGFTGKALSVGVRVVEAEALGLLAEVPRPDVVEASALGGDHTAGCLTADQ